MKSRLMEYIERERAEAALPRIPRWVDAATADIEALDTDLTTLEERLDGLEQRLSGKARAVSEESESRMDGAVVMPDRIDGLTREELVKMLRRILAEWVPPGLQDRVLAGDGMLTQAERNKIEGRL